MSLINLVLTQKPNKAFSLFYYSAELINRICPFSALSESVLF